MIANSSDGGNDNARSVRWSREAREALGVQKVKCSLVAGSSKRRDESVVQSTELGAG